jgi:hypothetical protein
VAIVTTGVHQSVVLRTVRKTIQFHHRKCIHVRAESNTPRGGAGTEHTHHACLANAPMHLDTPRLEPLRHKSGGSSFLEAKFGVRMQILTPARHFLVVGLASFESVHMIVERCGSGMHTAGARLRQRMGSRRSGPFGRFSLASEMRG